VSVVTSRFFRNTDDRLYKLESLVPSGLLHCRWHNYSRNGKQRRAAAAKPAACHTDPVVADRGRLSGRLTDAVKALHPSHSDSVTAAQPVPLISSNSIPEQLKKENYGGTGLPRFTWKA